MPRHSGGTRDLAFCLKVPLDSLLVWASSGGSGETARMRRLAWTFDARIGDKYQIRLTRPNFDMFSFKRCRGFGCVYIGPSTCRWISRYKMFRIIESIFYLSISTGKQPGILFHIDGSINKWDGFIYRWIPSIDGFDKMNPCKEPERN